MLSTFAWKLQYFHFEHCFSVTQMRNFTLFSISWFRHCHLNRLHNGIFVNAKHLQELSWFPTSGHMIYSQTSDCDARLPNDCSWHCFSNATCKKQQTWSAHIFQANRNFLHMQLHPAIKKDKSGISTSLQICSAHLNACKLSTEAVAI